jgi:hypothetical protein
MGSVGKSVSHAWKKVTKSVTGGGSSSDDKAATATTGSSGGGAAAEAEKAEVTDFDGVLSKGKKAKKSGTELGGGQRTFGALSETLG